MNGGDGNMHMLCGFRASIPAICVAVVYVSVSPVTIVK